MLHYFSILNPGNVNSHMRFIFSALMNAQYPTFVSILHLHKGYATSVHHIFIKNLFLIFYTFFCLFTCRCLWPPLLVCWPVVHSQDQLMPDFLSETALCCSNIRKNKVILFQVINSKTVLKTFIFSKLWIAMVLRNRQGVNHVIWFRIPTLQWSLLVLGMEFNFAMPRSTETKLFSVARIVEDLFATAKEKSSIAFLP